MIKGMKKPDGAVQLDTPKLYGALDRERRRRKMTLGEVADELCVNYLTLACWRRGGGINGDALVRLSLWMPRLDLRDYARHPEDPLPADQGRAA